MESDFVCRVVLPSPIRVIGSKRDSQIGARREGKTNEVKRRKTREVRGKERRTQSIAADSSDDDDDNEAISTHLMEQGTRRSVS